VPPKKKRKKVGLKKQKRKDLRRSFDRKIMK
jgi:hypothetical protein